MQGRIGRFLENFILLAIVLVLVQTFLEDYSILAGWSWDARRILIITGFCFDLLFTIEFLSRAIHSASKGTFGRYFMEERGWIDFLASIPLLMFNSGPELFALITGSGAILAFGGILNILKVVKAIRIARVLRLLRVLKIFRRIKNTDSVMAQRHVARIATMVVSTLVFTLLLLAVLEGLMGATGVDDLYEEFATGVVEHIDGGNLASQANVTALQDYANSVPIILLVRENGHTRYSRLEDSNQSWGPADYGYIEKDGIEFYFDIRHINVNEATVNLRYFFLIISLVLMLMFLYSPHFALTISDPIHIMRKGFDETGYNLEVRVPGEFKDDEVYRLARSYNANFLPLKDRESHSSGESVLNLSAEDFVDFGEMDQGFSFETEDDGSDIFTDSVDADSDQESTEFTTTNTSMDSAYEGETDVDIPSELDMDSVDSGFDDNSEEFDLNEEEFNIDLPDEESVSTGFESGDSDLDLPEPSTELDSDMDMTMDELDVELDSVPADETETATDLDSDTGTDSNELEDDFPDMENLDLDAGINLDGVETGLEDDFLDDDFSFDDLDDEDTK